MKILRIIARLNVGGPARHVVLLNAGLDARHHETLLVHGSLDRGEASLEHLAHERRLRVATVGDLQRNVGAFSDLRAFLALCRLIRQERPDVVHTHTAKAGTLGRLATVVVHPFRRHRPLVVHTFHGHVFEGYFSGAANLAVRSVERMLARVTDIVVTISPRQRDDIVARFGVASETQTVVVPLGLDLDALLMLPASAPDLRAALGIGDGEIVIGYAGRMVAVKDLETLLRAFARASAAVPALRLVLAGDGPERAAAEALAATLGIAGRTHFLGWTDDLPRFYATTDFCALSSLNEGTPVAAIEAMAAGRPVVSTAVGGVADVVDQGITGVLVGARDVPAMSEAFLQLATDEGLRHRMGAAGRARALVRYSHARLVDDIERLYSAGLAGKRAP
jgi:glycosyltransferase involved in cell wall biosynthesis